MRDLRPALFAALLLAASPPLPAAAQTTPEVRRVGALALTDASLDGLRKDMLPELRRLGFREGANLVMVTRLGEPEEMDRLAAELAAERPEVVVAVGSEPITAAAQAMPAVPVVGFGPDPVRRGVASTAARPGGNVTGVKILNEELDGKRAEILLEAVPAAKVMAVLVLRSQPTRQAIEEAVRRTAGSRGITARFYDVERPDEYPAAFAAMRRDGAEMLLVTGSPAFNRDASLLAGLAVGQRLPEICEWPENAAEGCLLGYGPSRPALRRRLAHFVAALLRGASAAELPLESPTTFELAVNLGVARRLGLELPPALTVRAEDLID